MTMAADRFTVAEDVLAAHLAGEAVLLDLRDKNYYRLNETAAAVWKEIERGVSREDLISAVLKGFEIGHDEAAAEVDALLSDLLHRNLIVHVK